MRAHPWFSALALGGLIVCVGCSTQEQLKRVENEVGDLKLEVFKLRSQMEESNKKADEDRSANSEGRTQDRRFQADLQETMRQLQDTTRILNNRVGEAASRSKARPVAPEAVPAAGPASSASEDEKAYTAALLDYNRGNYALAAEGLELFLKANPDSPRRPDAVFTLGLSWYNQKAFDKAKVFFERILKEHSGSNQFLPAKLKRAQCFARMGLKAAAIKAYKEITDGFKGSPEARTAQQELSDLGF